MTTTQRQQLQQDHGFTMAEFIVVVGLLSLVLAIAWAGMYVINKSAAVNEKLSTAAHDASDPLELISKSLMQNNMMAATDISGGNATGSNAVTVWTNPTMDTTPEMNLFTTVPYKDGKYKLIWQKWVTSSDMKSTLSSQTFVMSYNNVNKLVNVPLFTYYDASGTVLATSGNIPSSTRSMLIRVVAALPDSTTVEASRTVYFRNRN